MNFKIDASKYESIVKEITDYIIKRSNTLNEFIKEIFIFLTFIEPQIDLFDEEIHEPVKNGNISNPTAKKIRERSNYYEKKFIELFLYSTNNIYKKVKKTIKSKILNKEEEIKKLDYFHLNRYLIIINIFYQIFITLNAKDKKYKSFLVSFYWQNIIFSRIFFEEEKIETLKIINFYFNHKNEVFNIKLIPVPNEKFLYFKPNTFYLLFKNKIDNEWKANLSVLYNNYILNLFFGIIPIELDEILNKIFIYGKSSKKKAILYYFQRTYNDIFIRYEKTETYKEYNNRYESISSSMIETQKGGSYTLGYEATLRKIILTFYKNYFQGDINYYKTILSNDLYSKIISRNLKKDFYSEYKNDIEKLLFFLNKFGGLNFLQFSSFKRLEKENINYPLGYITGNS